MSEDSTSNSRRPIGVFDSGLGGLTVVREMLAAMPHEDIVYLGDTARVPYGNKSPQIIRTYSGQDAAFLQRFDPKMIVVACNTASATAIDLLESTCPMPVVDVIRPGAAAAVAATDGPIGVIGTKATVASGAYTKAIQAIDPYRRVLAAACPILVPIVEEGRPIDDPIVLHVLGDYLRELQRSRPGVLILGCTHYPLLAPAIAKLMGPDVPLVNSGSAAASRAKARLDELGLATGSDQPGSLRCYTTDSSESFAELGARYCGRPLSSVLSIRTDELERQ